MSRVKSVVLSRDALSLVLLIVVTGAFTVWWMHPFVNSFTLQTHGDQAWVQASAQVAMQSGPFGTNAHVGWDSGFNPWSYPGLGSIGFYLAAWMLGAVTSSSSNALVAIMAMTAAAVSVASYAALRLAAAERVRRFIAFWLALSLGLSPFVLAKMGHYNVAAWYLLPAVIAALGYLRSPRSHRAWAMTGLLIAIVTLISPLWWILLADYFLLIGLIIAVILRRWSWVRRSGWILLAVIVGGLLPQFLAVVNRVPGGTWNREQWDSTHYSGSLVDFLLGSPWLSAIWPRLQELAPAASREVSAVGLIPLTGGLLAVILALTAFLGFREESRAKVGWLLVSLQVVLLSFLTLGLGTLQEALLFIAGVESPLRGWSRLTILLALLGMLLAAPWLSRLWEHAGDIRRPLGAAIAVLISLVLGLVITMDARSIVQKPPRGLSTIEEAPAVEFLTATVGNCPVAQLPGGTFPDFPMADGTDVSITYYYRGFVPYLLNPEGNWSFGAPSGTSTSNLMRELPPTVAFPDMVALKNAGYCAVLFDKHYAEWLGAHGPRWPATSMKVADPAWSSTRFDVFVL